MGKDNKTYILKPNMKFWDSVAKETRIKGKKFEIHEEARAKTILASGMASLVSVLHPQHQQNKILDKIAELKSFEYKPKKKRTRKSRKVSA
jgi:hypothetical protein